jgi:hypothetical protein
MKKLLFQLVTVSCIFTSLSSCSEDRETDIFDEGVSQEIKEPACSGTEKLQINSHEAAFISNHFIAWNQNPATRSSQMEIKNMSAITSANVNDTLMYIFNYEDGFTIISAAKGVFPILAYSYEGSFDESENENNAGLSVWLDCTKKDITEALNDTTANSFALDNYEHFKTLIAGPETRALIYLDEIRNYKKIGPLISTYWDQKAPYNKYCPKNTLAGCVPIAMAQLINYHQRYDGGNINFAAIASGDDNMAAKLIADIGNGIQMTYKESYAHPAIDILNPFNYRTRIASFLNAKGYNTSYVEPINARPLNVPCLVEGFGENFLGTINWLECHWWIMDGYESYDVYQGWFETAEKRSAETRASEPAGTAYSALFFHFNWGWEDGYQNGWYGVSSSYLQFCKNFRKLNVLPK